MLWCRMGVYTLNIGNLLCCNFWTSQCEIFMYEIYPSQVFTCLTYWTFPTSCMYFSLHVWNVQRIKPHLQQAEIFYNACFALYMNMKCLYLFVMMEQNRVLMSRLQCVTLACAVWMELMVITFTRQCCSRCMRKCVRACVRACMYVPVFFVFKKIIFVYQ